MTTSALHRTPTISLAAEGLVASDGSIWSHAATLGTRFKGSEFTIDRATVESFIRNFTSGYPQKVPVDYEHGTTNGATSEGRPVPKAGDVLELRGVFAPGDFTDGLRTAAEKLAADAGRSLEDPSNYGLWMRWRPTNRALGMIKEREYTDLSIAFDENYPDNTTGKGQGPTLLAVALTNMPFLDDMLPVAASRDHGGPPAVIGQKEFTMSTKITMLAAAAALFGKPVADEEQGAAELTALSKELPALRSYAADVGAALGELDPAKAVAKVKQLQASVTEFERSAKEAKEKAVKTEVDAALKELESKFVPAMRPMLERELTREIGEGKAAKDTDVVKALTAAPDTGITTRSTGADDGSSSANASDDVKLDAKAKELMHSDEEVKALNASQGFSAAFNLALRKAGSQLQIAR